MFVRMSVLVIYHLFSDKVSSIWLVRGAGAVAKIYSIDKLNI